MRCDSRGKVSLSPARPDGIGRSIADELAANGSTVVYTDVRRVRRPDRRRPHGRAPWRWPST